MKLFICLLLFMSHVYGVFSQDATAVIKEADRLEALPNEKAAFNKFKEALVLQPANIYVLTRCSELCSRIGSRETNTANKRVYFDAALAYATKAVNLAPLNDRANVSLAMITGKYSMDKSGKEKIKSAKEVKRLIDIALKSNPNNFLAWHILGRWNYEIGNISSIERAAAKVFVGSIPAGSVKNAIMYLEKARTLSPHFILNNYELARAYHKNDEDTKAIVLLNALQGYPISTEDDVKIKSMSLALIKDWQ